MANRREIRKASGSEGSCLPVSIALTAWRDTWRNQNWQPKAGDKIVCRGRMGIYPGKSSYQLFVHVITKAGDLPKAQFALQSSGPMLQWFNDYFGAPYPLPKLDQIAVPNAFATFGAMENWGAITYIDTALLFDPATSSQANREAVFGVIAHEVAHQWFGDQVTMHGYDDVWFKEGMATLLAYLALAWRYWFSIPFRGIALTSVLFAAGLLALWLQVAP